MSIAEGGCLCGAVRYGVSAAPSRVTICHCTFCQRATGGAFLVEPIFNADELRILKGEPAQYSHRSAGSGKMVHVHFCASCGTKLYLSFERFADAVGLFGGTFDTPNWFERSAANTKHIFLSEAQKGVVIPAGVNTFQNHSVENDGTLNAPTVYDEPHVI